MEKLYFIRANKTKYGGAEVYLSRLSAELTREKVEHKLIHSSLPKSLFSWVRVLVFNRNICTQKQVSDFYFSLERIACADIYRAGDGVHKVFVEIEKKSKWNPLHSVYIALEEKCFNNSKKIIANSEMIKKQIIDTYDISPEKIKVIYNGVKLENMNLVLSRSTLKDEFQIDFSEKKVLLYVGSGFQRKGVKEFLTILSKLQYRNFIAFIIGKEKKIKYYKNLAKKLGLEDKVIFTGARDDVPNFYSISDIFLFPTRYEPFSNVVLEAMNYENVVITTRQNGASEILDEAYVMATPDDLSILPNLELLLEDEEKLQEVKKRNLEIVQNFSIEKNVEETLKVIHEVID